MQLLDAPDTYKPGTYGGWNLRFLQRGDKPGIPVLPSYFSGFVPVPTVTPALFDSTGLLWMSITAMERESQFRHNAHAQGRVVVMGAGMGLLPFNLLRNPNVTEVIVIERSAELCEHWADIVGLSSWENAGKLTLVHGDALEWKGTCNTLLADIWPLLGDDALERDMATFRRNIRFRRMMCWGAELAFIMWAMSNGIRAASAQNRHAEKWSRETGHYVWPDFLRDAANAAITAALTIQRYQ